MSLWRDTTTEQTQSDVDKLLDSSVGFAQQQLDKNGEFFPCAVELKKNHQIAMLAVRPNETDEQPSSADVITACVASLQDTRRKLLAGAIVSDVSSPKLGDAIQVVVEHKSGLAITVLIPYTNQPGHNTYGDPVAIKAEKQIW